MILQRTVAGKGELLAERAAAQRRLAHLLAQVDGNDHHDDPNELDVLRTAVNATLQRIAHCDEVLEPKPAPILPHVAMPMTPREERAAARTRLGLVLNALDHLPEGCREASKILRRAIRREIRKIAATRR